MTKDFVEENNLNNFKGITRKYPNKMSKNRKRFQVKLYKFSSKYSFTKLRGDINSNKQRYRKLLKFIERSYDRDFYL